MLDLNRTMFYKTEFNILAPKGKTPSGPSS